MSRGIKAISSNESETESETFHHYARLVISWCGRRQNVSLLALYWNMRKRAHPGQGPLHSLCFGYTEIVYRLISLPNSKFD